jgi:gliding motility-associated-like protein
MKWLVCLCIILNSVIAYPQLQRLSNLNLDHFTSREKKSPAAFEKFFPADYLSHPDLGIMPYNGVACENCFELLDHRDAYSRYFIEANSNGKTFYQQTAYSPINYLDSDGRWREINYRLAKKSETLFEAIDQPTAISIELNSQTVLLRQNKYSLETKSPLLYWRNTQGEDHLLGEPDFSNYETGDDGVKIKNVYPGIDLIYVVKTGEIETFYVINDPLPYSSGELILKQQFNLPQELSFQPENKNHWNSKDIYITNNANVPFFKIEKGYALENNTSSELFSLRSRITENDMLEFSVPFDWLTNPATKYPVIIDPVVVSLDSLPIASFMGTRYSPVCWTNSCDYFLTVPTPPNSTITQIRQSFEYYATGPCFADDGGYSIDFLGCHTPAAAPGVFTNTFHFNNTATSNDSVPIPEFIPCFPAPQCAPQNLNFVLHFYRCNTDPDTSCTSNCILATRPWIMEIRGKTLELSYINSAIQICDGDSAQLVVTAQYGVPPYTYSWAPGLSVTDTIVVKPSTNTLYTATVTDACGNTVSDTTTVTVTTNNNPGFTITPNPVCVNTPVTLTGNAGGLPADYDWYISGSDAVGGIVNDNISPIVNYTLPGTFDVILSYGTCAFKDTIQLIVTPQQAATVLIAAQPSLTACLGDTITFHATSTNGGAAPLYDWLIDGNLIQSGITDSLVTSAFNNGSLIQAILHSNSTCASNTIDTASLFVAIVSALVPQVSISPDTIVCLGSPLTLSTNSTNCGTTPTFQWLANGIPIAGATSSTYTFNVTPPDTVISVLVNSSLSCVTTPFAGDTTIVNTYQNIAPSVLLTANPVGVVCSGDSIVYAAQTTNGGSTPQFQWFVNGVLSANTDSTFTVFPSNNDSVSVLMTTSIACAAVPTGNDYSLASVTPAVSPVVTVSAAPSATICVGDSVTIVAHAVSSGNPSYSWTVNGNPAGINDSILTLSTVNNNDLIEVIVNSSLSCAPIPSDTDQVTISVLNNVTPAVAISVTGNPVCEGEPIQFIASSTNGGINPAVQWLINGVSTGLTNDTILLSTLNNGDTLQVAMTSSLNCVTSTAAVSALYIATLQKRLTPEITITGQPSDSLCQGQKVQILAGIKNGGTAPVIQWYVNGILSSQTTTLFNQDSLGSGDIVVANLISNERCLMQSSDTSNFIRILYRQPLQVSLTSGLLGCAGIPTIVTAHPSGGNWGPYHLSWNNGSIDTTQIEISPDRNTEVIVQVEDNCSLWPAYDTLKVPILQSPLANFAYYNPFEGSFLNTIQFINTSIDADSWIWYFPDSTTSTDLNPKHTFPGKGTYEIKLYTLSNSGCFDSIIYSINVFEEVAVFYPNSFTPNADGNNDFFRPLGASLENYEMTIWNRWGEKIYEGDDKSAWDGTVKNSSKQAPEGVYVFRVDLKMDSGDRVVTGRVTLIR